MKFLPWLTISIALAPAAAQQLCGKPVDQKLWTKPERTEWRDTSSSKDVAEFLKGIQKAHPDAFQLGSIGRSLRGRPIPLATVRRESEGGPARLRAVIIANIHGGEVEGKEAMQVLLREIALGGHKDILAACDLWIVPIYNVDGNDEIQAGNRSSQNGPAKVGVRRNSQDLDLNRDVVKAETPETRALLKLFNEVDPHLFMDLHTTNGSAHGYHLTYAPSLSTNMDRALDDFMHAEFIPKMRAAVLENHAYRVFDYGNFGRGRQPSSWTTYAHTPRYAINYYGLRNRLSLLSEAYSYLPFRDRAHVTRAFVVESLRQLVAQKDKVMKLCAAADAKVMKGDMSFGYATDFRKAEKREVLVGSVAREGQRRVAGKDFRPVEMDMRNRFESTKSIPYPKAWAISGATDATRRTLLLHHVEVLELAAPAEVQAESFTITSAQRPRFRYEGHRLVTLRGKLTAGKHTLPAGTLIVPARQRNGRIAAQLLEAQSEDSLATWNFFDQDLTREPANKAAYPVLRVTKHPDWKLKAVTAGKDGAMIHAAYTAAEKVPANAIFIKVTCTKIGTRSGGRGYESNMRWKGREVIYAIGPQRLTKLTDVKQAVVDLLANPSSSTSPFAIQPDNSITNAELLGLAKVLSESGAKKVFLKREPE